MRTRCGYLRREPSFETAVHVGVAQGSRDDVRIEFV
jgi:hypothetical protein